ncbi:MAG: hypothetical protein ACKO96_23615, partial [Flammeovirgaceae bacterium]
PQNPKTPYLNFQIYFPEITPIDLRLQLIGRAGTAPEAIKLRPACLRHSLVDLLYSIPKISRDFLFTCSCLGLFRKGSKAAASLLK